jgi:hypothetical protein
MWKSKKKKHTKKNKKIKKNKIQKRDTEQQEQTTTKHLLHKTKHKQNKKGLNERKAEIRVQFKESPTPLFPESVAPRNELVIRVQPNEAVYMKLNNKQPGLCFFVYFNFVVFFFFFHVYFVEFIYLFVYSLCFCF